MEVLISKRIIAIHLDRYCDDLREQRLSRSTMQCYASRASQFVAFLMTSTSDPLDIEKEAERYCDVLREELYAPSSINASLTVIEDFLAQVTLKTVKFPRLEAGKRDVRSLTEEEQLRFIESLSTCDSVKDRLLLLLLYHTGIGISRLIDLNIDDVVVSAHTGKIVLHSPFCNHDQGVCASKSVTLNEQTRRAALLWLIERHELTSEDERALLINAKGQRITSAGAGHLVKRFGWKIQLEMSGRILRNTCLANMAASADSSELDTVKDTEWGSLPVAETVDIKSTLLAPFAVHEYDRSSN